MDVDKRMGMSRGVIVSLCVMAVPMSVWLIGFSYGDLSPAAAIAITLAKMSAFGGMALFAWTLILSGRWRVLDRLFGGQDKVYVAHRLLATLALALLLIHPIALVLGRWIDSQDLGRALGATFHIADFAIAIGIIAFFGLLTLILWSVTARVKHETFLRVHRLLGIMFVLAASHALLSGSVVANNQFLWWYLAILTFVAIASFVHYSFLGDFLHRHYAYKVVVAKRHRGDVIEIQLRPVYRHMPFMPGQFAYVAFDKLFDNEYHPFSIASGKRSSTLQFYVRLSGDYTKELIRLQPGDTARVKGAYGGFTFQDKSCAKQLWIAGGIGITPFLSQARSLPKARRYPQIELIYAVRTAGDAFAARELQHIEHTTASFNYTLVHANRYGTTSLYDLAEHFSDLSERTIYICGPPSMLKAYEAQARRLGISEQLHFEEFQF